MPANVHLSISDMAGFSLLGVKGCIFEVFGLVWLCIRLNNCRFACILRSQCNPRSYGIHSPSTDLIPYK